MISQNASMPMFAAATALAVLPFAFVALSPIPLLGAAVREDGIIEYLGALAWLGGAVGFSITAARRWRARAPVDIIWLAGLALMCLLAAGEEISWGQRIFGYGTPAVIAESNLQQEMNFHNLALLDIRVNADGEQKSGLSRWLTFNRLGSLIWLGYLVALPLAIHYSRPLARLANRVRLPCPPLWVAVAGAATFLAFALTIGALDESTEHGRLRRTSANEVKESIVGLLFFLAAWSICRRSAPVRVPGQRATSNEFDARDSR